MNIKLLYFLLNIPSQLELQKLPLLERLKKPFQKRVGKNCLKCALRGNKILAQGRCSIAFLFT